MSWSMSGSRLRLALYLVIWLKEAELFQLYYGWMRTLWPNNRSVQKIPVLFMVWILYFSIKMQFRKWNSNACAMRGGKKYSRFGRWMQSLNWKLGFQDFLINTHDDTWSWARSNFWTECTSIEEISSWIQVLTLRTVHAHSQWVSIVSKSQVRILP